MSDHSWSFKIQINSGIQELSKVLIQEGIKVNTEALFNN